MSDPKTAEEYALLRARKADEEGWDSGVYVREFHAELERAFEAGRMSMLIQLLEDRKK